MNDDALARARAMRAHPSHRLVCPSCRRGVTVYAAGIIEGWCGCGRKLRPLALDEAIASDGKTYRKGTA